MVECLLYKKRIKGSEFVHIKSGHGHAYMIPVLGRDIETLKHNSWGLACQPDLTRLYPKEPPEADLKHVFG